MSACSKCGHDPKASDPKSALEATARWAGDDAKAAVRLAGSGHLAMAIASLAAAEAHLASLRTALERAGGETLP